MGTPRTFAALVLLLSCAIDAVSCVQEPDTNPETPQETSGSDSTATAASTDDLGRLGTGENKGGDLTWNSPTMDGSGDPMLRARCLNLARASVSEREEFCRSLPDLGVRARCWRYRYNDLQWTGWCFFEFSD